MVQKAVLTPPNDKLSYGGNAIKVSLRLPSKVMHPT